MRILVDASSLLLRSAGIKSYTWNWIQHLRQAAPPGDEIFAFPFLSCLGGLEHERSVLPAHATWPRLALLYAANVPGSPVLRWLARDADVFHISNQLRRNIPRSAAITATVHDLTCWLMPQFHTAANVRADRAFAREVLSHASRLIAVSENTRRDAVRLLDIDPSRIETIYSGVAPAYFDARPRPAARPYVLYVGTIEPRKNIDRLLDAWQNMRYNRDFDLVVIGATGWGSENTLARLRGGIPGVQYHGYVREAELPGWTAGAAAFVYPSLYEGFGFPVAQAMAARVPVITSNNSCLPEVAGGGALLVDPGSPEEIRAALERLLESPELRAGIAARGRARAEHYRWDACARRSLEFFRRASGAE